MKSGIFRDVAGSEKEGRIKYVRGAEFYSNLDSFVRQGDHVIIAEYRYERVLMSKDFSNTGISTSNTTLLLFVGHVVVTHPEYILMI